MKLQVIILVKMMDEAIFLVHLYFTNKCLMPCISKDKMMIPMPTIIFVTVEHFGVNFFRNWSKL